VVPVVRRIEAKLRKPANGTVTSTVSTPGQLLDDMMPELAAKGLALASINVELHDQAGTHVLSATVEWFIARAS
jgi:hypothetical protein